MSQPNTAHDLPALSVLCDAAREGGEVALRYFKKDPKRWMKPGNSPVTEADLAIDAMLHERLRKAFPAFGWLSEEIEDDGSRHNGAPTFIVDPIDGTRGFMAGNDEWLVSIGVVDGPRPALGVLFNPVLGTLFYAQRGKGAFVEEADGTTHALVPTGKQDLAEASVAFPGPSKPSHTFTKAPKLASLALRIAHVGWGKSDGCVASPGAKHWDIVATDLIVEEAGIALTNAQGELPLYNGPSVAHGPLLCGTPAMRTALAAYLP